MMPLMRQMDFVSLWTGSGRGVFPGKRQHMNEGSVTLLFGAKDMEHNQVVVLREFLEEKI